MLKLLFSNGFCAFIDLAIIFMRWFEAYEMHLGLFEIALFFLYFLILLT